MPNEQWWWDVRARYLLPRDVIFLDYNTIDAMERLVGAVIRYLTHGV